jgi:hypothetical protein
MFEKFHKAQYQAVMLVLPIGIFRRVPLKETFIGNL